MRSERDLHKRGLNLMVCRARRRRNLKPNLTKPIVKTFPSREKKKKKRRLGPRRETLAASLRRRSGAEPNVNGGGGRKAKEWRERKKVCKLFQPSKLEVFIGSKAPRLTQRRAHTRTRTHAHNQPPVVFTAGLTAVIC